MALLAMTFLVACEASEKECREKNGTWSEVEEVCVARDCSKKGACLRFKNGADRCERVRVGMSWSEAQYWLGFPDEFDGRYASYRDVFWSATVTVEDGEVREVECVRH